MKSPACIGCKHLDYKIPASYTKIPHINGYMCKLKKYPDEKMDYFFVRKSKECWERR